MSFSLSARQWQFLFFGLAALYLCLYAPYGVNETDGGFLTGLAWQVLSGKILYQDIIYVRPPLPVWLRALEIRLLPEQWAILGERWIFYGKLLAYSWLGAAALTQGKQRWILASLGFLVSAHCYPAMAWHTVDGILLAVLAAWLLLKGRALAVFAAGIVLAGSLLCKQSFYPLLPVFVLIALLGKQEPLKTTLWLTLGFLLAAGTFAGYLHLAGLLEAYRQMTAGAASAQQAIQHGLVDYFRITPELAIPGLILLIPAFYWHYRQQKPDKVLILWGLWLVALPMSYAAITWLRQEHTVPFAQSRAMFWIGLWFYGVHNMTGEGSLWQRILDGFRVQRAGWLLMAVSWSAAVSWGYNLPILFATPWVWAGMQLSKDLASNTAWKSRAGAFPWIYALFLVLAFRVGFNFIYRDGNRADMTEPLGRIFPAMQGIYSDAETAGLYQELAELAVKHPRFTVLPAFPQANFLTHTYPPLPLDWVVNRETNGRSTLLEKALESSQPILFIQKSQWTKIQSDPEMSFTRECIENGKILEESPFFYILQPNNGQ